MATGSVLFVVLLTVKLPAFMEAVPLDRELYWLVMGVLLGGSAFLFWKKRLYQSLPSDANDTLLALEQAIQNTQATQQEKEQVAVAVSEHWQAVNTQLLQLKTQLEAKNKVLDHLMQHLLPKALAVDSLKAPAQELFDLVKSVQLATHFSDHSLAELPTDFEQKLLHKHPDLTEEDLRLCAYLYLHLNSQQIAKLKAISVAGVNKSRSRLRKKLQLGAEVDLGMYLSGLQGE